MATNTGGNHRELGSDPTENKSHPIGKPVGGAAGAVTGAAAGAVAGPIGAMAGGLIGAIAGWLEGKTIAEMINPDEEMKYWEKQYRNEPYYKADKRWDDYKPAYITGYYYSDDDEDNDDAYFSDLRSNWNSIRGNSTLEADEAVAASRAARTRMRSRNA